VLKAVGVGHGAKLPVMLSTPPAAAAIGLCLTRAYFGLSVFV
jgi:hypothetical protein